VCKALNHVPPHYRLPARWARLDRLPQNGNGKIDRRLIRERFLENSRDAVA
jgi:acyl-CoA synthetase (AMP-forming)/AMP-acid ligase II